MKSADGGWSDPLGWWKAHQPMFPIVAEIARIYLGIQATSAPSERVFSAANNMIGEKRVRLKPKVAGQLLMVKRNWKWFEKESRLADVLDNAEPANNN